MQRRQIWPGLFLELFRAQNQMCHIPELCSISLDIDTKCRGIVVARRREQAYATAVRNAANYPRRPKGFVQRTLQHSPGCRTQFIERLRREHSTSREFFLSAANRVPHDFPLAWVDQVHPIPHRRGQQ
jgi:hypothetical protein